MNRDLDAYWRQLKKLLTGPLDRLTANLRLRPTFLIIGGQRCGTTSLYVSLCRHPRVRMSKIKEVQYFSLHHEKPDEWYYSHFPLDPSKVPLRRNGAEERPPVGEATPYYLFHPLAPRRVEATKLDLSFIVILRDPVDRAFSHFYHEKRAGREEQSAQEAFRSQEARLEHHSWGEAPPVDWSTYRNKSYLARGRYKGQLENWFRFFSPSDFFITTYRDCFENPQEGLGNVCNFLDVPTPPDVNLPSRNRSAGYTVPEDLEADLRGYFEPHNEELFELIGRRFEWWNEPV